VTATQPPVGSRGNGLTAGGWARVADCDPRVADELLSLLADAAIAACAAPSPGERGGYLEVRLPRRPVDRLYVDAARRGDAERLVRTRLGEPLGQLTGPASPSANDETFDAIVAGWSVEQVGDWPEAENLRPGDLPPSQQRRRRTDPPPPVTPQRLEPGLLDPGGLLYDTPPGDGPRPQDPFEDDDNHYEPPPPPPGPPLRTATKYAWLAVALGVLALVAVPLDWVTDTQLADVLGGLLVLGGVGSLVWHLRDDDSPRDGPDDGAVV
jgi:hypothetical protein